MISPMSGPVSDDELTGLDRSVMQKTMSGDSRMLSVGKNTGSVAQAEPFSVTSDAETASERV